MSQKSLEELIREVLNSLNKISNGGYTEILERHENSVDFILDGEMKLVGINFQVDQKVFIRISPMITQSPEQVNGIRFNIGVIARIVDFTTGKNGKLQYYDFFDTTKYPLTGSSDTNWATKVERMHHQVIRISSHLMKQYTPSHRLSSIVGGEPKTKIEILELVSEYILSNNLRYSNGHLKVDGYLKQFYGKNTFTVCENTFFDTLRENTLISEIQAKQFSLKNCNFSLIKKANFKMNFVSSSTCEYLTGLL